MFLPNTENITSHIFAFSSGLIGLYGGIRGKSTSKTAIANKEKNNNTLEIPAGIIRLILSFICIIIGIILASISIPETQIMLMLGLGGEFLGISVPGIANHFLGA